MPDEIWATTEASNGVLGCGFERRKGSDKDVVLNDNPFAVVVSLELGSFSIKRRHFAFKSHASIVSHLQRKGVDTAGMLQYFIDRLIY